MVSQSEFSVYDPVRFSYQGRVIRGNVARKTRSKAAVVSIDNKEYTVPWRLLSRDESRRRMRVFLEIDRLKSKFRPDDEVSFPSNSGTVRGVIARLGPKNAVVVAEDGSDYYVPYGVLHRISGESGRSDDRRLFDVIRVAERLISFHNLKGWSFQFDDSLKRAGCCRFETKVISLARLYCLNVSDDEVRDTVLHEIAHALAGPGHNHDTAWKEKARSIGCTAERCHRAVFAPPRYIVSCPTCKWVEKTNLDRSDSVCLKCHGPVKSRSYTRRAWEGMQSRKPERLPMSLASLLQWFRG